MIVVLKENANPKQVENLIQWLKSLSLDIHISTGASQTVLGLVGDTTAVDIDLIQALDIVQDVKRIQEPYKKANRKFHPLDTVIDCGGGVKVGGGAFQIIAGPCSIESEEQIIAVAEAVKRSGAGILRGGAFKPRTSPYAFQGLRGDGIRLLLEAKRATGMPVITEIMDISQLDLFDEVDIIQVGARNMQNFEMLKQLGKVKKPILLKRGLSNTYQELLMSAEYIMSGGNENLMLCERGIRTFETFTRNTLDVSAVPVLKELSHLPVVIDPSHAAGLSRLVEPLSLSAVAAGCDALMIEVHNDLPHAKCDGPQSLRPEAFDRLARKVRAMRSALTSAEGVEA